MTLFTISGLILFINYIVVRSSYARYIFLHLKTWCKTPTPFYRIIKLIYINKTTYIIECMYCQFKVYTVKETTKLYQNNHDAISQVTYITTLTFAILPYNSRRYLDHLYFHPTLQRTKNKLNLEIRFTWLVAKDVYIKTLLFQMHLWKYEEIYLKFEQRYHTAVTVNIFMFKFWWEKVLCLLFTVRK